MTAHSQGAAHYSTKLTATQVRQIRALYDRGVQPTVIASRFGASRSQVSKIGRRQTWLGIEPAPQWVAPKLSRDEIAAFDGMRIGDAADKLGADVPTARKWVNAQGLRCKDNVIRRVKDPREVDDEIRARLAAAPPSAPCFRCGARGACEHRSH
jgi:uncharacterized protein YjcR